MAVVKGSQALVFECYSDGTTLDIGHMSAGPAGGRMSAACAAVHAVVWAVLCRAGCCALGCWASLWRHHSENGTTAAHWQGPKADA